MFSSLPEKEKLTVIMAMEEFITEQKQKVIVQGDEGNSVYVVESGTL
jgi:CRP-like cAMP-binding protein